jgi:hypothetical protein
MSKKIATPWLMAASLTLSVPAIMNSTPAHADSEGRAMANGECSTRDECDDMDGRGILLLFGGVAVLVLGTLGVSEAVTAIRKTFVKKDPNQGPDPHP